MCLETSHASYLHTILNNNDNIDHYRVLELEEDKDNKEKVRRQYLKLSRIYHPDKCTDPHSKELFLLISNSFQSLTDCESSGVLTFEESLELLLKNFGADKYCEPKLFVKTLMEPQKLSFGEKISLTHAIYKLFINKNG